MRPETAFIYRRGLAKEDLSKETVTVKIANTLALGAIQPPASQNQGGTPSTSSLLTDLINLRKKQEGVKPLNQTLDLAEKDSFSGLREKLSAASEKDCMAGILQTSKGDAKKVSHADTTY